MRLIDADKLKEIIEKWCPKNKCGENTDEDNYIGEIICDVFKTIDEQPTVEERPLLEKEQLERDLKAQIEHSKRLAEQLRATQVILKKREQMLNELINKESEEKEK